MLTRKVTEGEKGKSWVVVAMVDVEGIQVWVLGGFQNRGREKEKEIERERERKRKRERIFLAEGERSNV
eukprot:661526-Amorphochlora_amoeboformis.AAC.1